MWSETVGLRTKPVSDQEIGLDFGLGLEGSGLGIGLVKNFVLFTSPTLGY